MALLQFTNKGIWCEQANVYIDPWRPVDRALITHGHSDHSRYGSKRYLCTEIAAPAIKYRLGKINLQTTRYGEVTNINGVDFSFYPAGHIIGSAQIRVAYKGEVWVASGDYKTEDDGLSTAFEPVKCNTFITECTFGLPIYKWKNQKEIFSDINNWWKRNKETGKVSFISAYSLGKAQRVLQGLDNEIGRIYTHTAVENINQVIRSQGVSLQETIQISKDTNKKDLIGNIVIAPPAAIGSNWSKKMTPQSVGVASGWMAIRGARRRRAVDRGFVLSDHADWDGLNRAIEATGATRVICTHGFTDVFAKWLREKGLDARTEYTEFEGETNEVISEEKVTGS